MRKLYAFVFALVATLTVRAQISVTVTGNSNTTPALQTSYISLAAALTDLNAVTAMTGPVTLGLAAGSSETVPATGLTVGSASLNAVLSSTNSVTIIKAAGAASVLNAGVGTATPSSASPDGILKLTGADYITIDGLTFTDGNTTNPATMEFGVGLFKLSATDGAQNNTIKNCIFNMQRVNNANSTSPMVEGSVGILVINSSHGAAVTVITPTAASGTNSGNKIYSNTINGGNYGIALSGFAASSPFTLGDTGNDIGGTGSVSATTGNTILNYGGGGTSNPAAGIRANNQWELNVSNNNINNNNGSGVNHGTTLRGIYAQAGTSANVTISYNTISVNSAATSSALTGIENAIGSTASSNTVTITNNLVQNCTYTTATTATFTGITNTATAAIANINSNQVVNNNLGSSGSANSCTLIGIYGSGTATTTNMNNNTVSGNSVLNSYGAMHCIRGGSSNTTVNGNTISNNTFPNSASTTSSTLYGIYDVAGPTLENYTNNNINNLSITGSSTATSHAVYGIYNVTSGSSVVTCSGNNINNLSFTSSSTSGYATVAGIRNSYGQTVNDFKNVIHTLSSTGTTPTVAGIYAGSTSITTINVFNNLIGNLSTPSSTGANLHGIFAGSAGTNLNFYNNTVYLNTTSTGTGFGSSAIYFSSTSPTVTMRNNILVNLSTATGSGQTTVIRRTATSLTSYGNTSNNNLLYAGVPSATNLVYYDGTNSYQTLGALKSAVSPREANSVTETVSTTAGIYFQSLTGPATGIPTTFLHLVNGLSSFAEAGGSGSGLSFSDDYDGDIRNATTPDIGADEFNGVVPVINDIAIVSLVNPLALTCETNNVTASVRITNAGTTTINFGTTNAVINAVISGAGTGNLSATVSSGTLAPGANLDVVLTPSFSMLASGAYNFTITLTMSGDAIASNNTLNAVSSINPVVPLPQSVDFTGFTSSNLTAVFPNWYEAAGATVPGGTTSNWVSTTGTLGAGNVTSKINLYTNTMAEWMVGPKFAATANSKLKFDVAITDYNLGTADPAGMQGTDDKVVVRVSTDCGFTWTDLYTFNAANTTTITNSLVPQEISLAAYAGQNVIVAFFGSDGPTDDTPDYDFHIDNINIVNVLPTDVGASGLAFPSAIGCYGATETVKITIKNYGTSPIDFSLNPVTVTTNVTGGTTATLTGTINSGILAANATTDVTMTGTLNMSAAGVYTFNASTSMTGDAQASNNAMPAINRTVVAPVTLPQTVDFTGYTGADLTTFFPNWYEASGFPGPSGTTSSWVNRVGLGTASNVTAKVNLYTTGKNEWIIGPKFTATSLTQLTYKVAITDYNTFTVDPSGMQGTDDKVVVKISTDCGNSWSDLRTYDASNTTSITNTLVPQTISLASYAGQNIIIAFYANEGTVDDAPDYDFHIDDINIDNVPLCTGAVGGTATAGTSTFCASGSTTISVTGFSTGTGSVYQWESSIDNTNWNTVTGEINPASINTPTVTATTYYRLKVTCPSGTAIAYSNTITITINPLPTATVTPGGPVVLCAPATQVLTSNTNAPAATYQWKLNGNNIGSATNATYSAAASGSYTVAVTQTSTGCVNTSAAVLVTINPLPGTITLTPSSAAICAGNIQPIAASTPGSGLNVTSGTGASTSLGSSTGSGLGPNPLQNYYGADKVQMLFSATELTALGLSGGSPITAIKLNLPGADVSYALQSLTVKMKNTSSTALSTTGWETGLTTVKNPANYSPVIGLNTLTLDNSFAWDGTSNLAIEINYSNSNTGTTGTVYNTALYSPTTFVSTIMYRADNATVATADGYTTTPTYSYSSRNDVTFVTSSPNFTWLPVTGLYTDAAGTVAYTGTATATVYAKPAATTTYTVTATSTAGCTSSNTINVAISAATSITTQPTAQAVCAGANASFTVAATGGALTYQWRKGGVNITGANSATFTITGVASTDAANYDVVITGGCGNVTSNAVALTVNAATAITTQPTAQAVCAGANASFTVAGTGSGTLTYQWRKAGVNISGATNASYTINNIVAGDAANYDVVVTGTCGNATSNAVALTINAATAISTQPTAQAICAGANATFTVAATGTGTLTYQWRKAGVNISGATNASYTINSVTAGDAANYDVVVTGTCGSITSNAVALTVNAATNISTQPAAQSACAGSNVTFTVAGTGSGTLTYQWRKAGANITGATNNSYTINNITAADAANYDVVVTGACGSVTSAVVALTVNPKPVVDYTFTAAQCIATNYTYTNTATVSGGTITTTAWDFGDGSTSTSANPSHAFASTGTFNVKLVATTNNGCKDSVTKAVTVSICTGIPPVNADISSALLMPNLVEQTALLRVTAVKSAKISWKVVDMQGRTVLHFDQMVNAGQNDRMIYLEQLAAGRYQLTGVTEKGKSITIRFVKQ